MKYLLSLLLIMVFCLPIGVNALETQVELTDKTSKELKTVEDMLKETYDQIIQDYSEDSEFIKKFIKSQEAWEVYRDSYLNARFPHDKKEGYYGSILPMCLLSVRNELAKDRLDQINSWLKGSIEGDVCAGSIKVRH